MFYKERNEKRRAAAHNCFRLDYPAEYFPTLTSKLFGLQRIRLVSMSKKLHKTDTQIQPHTNRCISIIQGIRGSTILPPWGLHYCYLWLPESLSPHAQLENSLKVTACTVGTLIFLESDQVSVVSWHKLNKIQPFHTAKGRERRPRD